MDGENETKGKCPTWCSICSICWLVLVAFLIFCLSCAEIVMGRIHVSNCPKDIMIPLYLVVMGGTGVIFAASAGASMKKMDKSISQLDICDWIVIIAGVIVVLFSLIWFCVGNYFVFTLDRDTTVFHEPPFMNAITRSVFKDLYCHYDVYWFAYYSIIVRWVLLGLIIGSFVWLAILICLEPEDDTAGDLELGGTVDGQAGENHSLTTEPQGQGQHFDTQYTDWGENKMNSDNKL